MKCLTLTVVSALTGGIAAFPTVADSIARGGARHKRQVPSLFPAFSAEHQYVSTSGKHEFVAPNLAAGDQRGPCPGLNASKDYHSL